MWVVPTRACKVIRSARTTMNAPPAPPKEIAQFEIVRRLGAGGMAEVFLAKKRGAEGTFKVLVLKRILPAHLGSRRFRAMFIEEAQLATRLNHPNVVQVYEFQDFGDEGLLLAMEYVEGCDLGRAHVARRSRRGRRIPPWVGGLDHRRGREGPALRAREEGRGAAQPLEIVHRDVSPQNVLLSFEGAVKIADFGIASARLFAEEQGVLKGKFGYMSPEQARGEKRRSAERPLRARRHLLGDPRGPPDPRRPRRRGAARHRALGHRRAADASTCPTCRPSSRRSSSRLSAPSATSDMPTGRELAAAIGRALVKQSEVELVDASALEACARRRCTPRHRERAAAAARPRARGSRRGRRPRCRSRGACRGRARRERADSVASLAHAAASGPRIAARRAGARARCATSPSCAAPRGPRGARAAAAHARPAARRCSTTSPSSAACAGSGPATSTARTPSRASPRTRRAPRPTPRSSRSTSTRRWRASRKTSRRPSPRRSASCAASRRARATPHGHLVQLLAARPDDVPRRRPRARDAPGPHVGRRRRLPAGAPRLPLGRRADARARVRRADLRRPADDARLRARAQPLARGAARRGAGRRERSGRARRREGGPPRRVPRGRERRRLGRGAARVPRGRRRDGHRQDGAGRDVPRRDAAARARSSTSSARRSRWRSRTPRSPISCATRSARPARRPFDEVVALIARAGGGARRRRRVEPDGRAPRRARHQPARRRRRGRSRAQEEHRHGRCATCWRRSPSAAAGRRRRGHALGGQASLDVIGEICARRRPAADPGPARHAPRRPRRSTPSKAWCASSCAA